MWSMIFIGLGAWLFSHWLEYATTSFADGTPLSSTVGFWRFIQVSTTHQSLTISARTGASGFDTGELGRLGYVREALQACGFALGGLAVHGYLSDVEACSACQRYAKTTGIIQRVSGEQFGRALDHVGITLPGIVDQLKTELGNKSFVGLNLLVAQCPKCHCFSLRPEVVVQSGRTEIPRKLGRYNVDPNQAGRVLGLPSEFRTAGKK